MLGLRMMKYDSTFDRLVAVGAGSDFQFSIWSDVPHPHFLRSRLYGKLRIERLTLASSGILTPAS
jgi:hypothetical protein